MDLHQVNEPINATKCKLSSSTFNDVNLSDATFTNVNASGWTLEDVNLQHLTITNANLSHASISESCIHDMTINGIKVTDLLACYSTVQELARLQTDSLAN